MHASKPAVMGLGHRDASQDLPILFHIFLFQSKATRDLAVARLLSIAGPKGPGFLPKPFMTSDVEPI